MPQIKKRRRRGRPSRPDAFHPTLFGFVLMVKHAGAITFKLASYLTRILFRAQGFLAVALTICLVGLGMITFKTQVMDAFKETMPVSFEVSSDNESLRMIIEPQLQKIHKTGQQKHWTRKQFDGEVVKMLKAERGIAGAVLRNHMGGLLSISVSAHRPTYALSDSTGNTFIFDQAASLIGKAPVRGLAPAPYAVNLKNDALRVRASQGSTQLGPVSSILHRAHAIYTRLSGLKLAVMGPISVDNEQGFTLCVRVSSMPPNSCLSVLAGPNPPRQESLLYLAEQLKGLADSEPALWPRSLDLNLKDKILLRGPNPRDDTASNRSSLKAE